MPKLTSGLRYLFSPTYVEDVFYFWYKNRQLGASWFNKNVPADENGRKASFSTLQNWIQDYHWMERAENLDVEAARKMDNLIIDERIKMFREHAEIGKEIKEMGIEFLRTKGLEKDASALRAIADGIQIERSSRGLADVLAKISTMGDDDIEREIRKLMPSYVDADVEDISPTNEEE